ncbi:hypothetical protein J5J86_17575 [Aquabacter sp. L1I39]|uniref:hypothetical protein n=1 Tax=Aquabacter sp. L1I39 TaxID=2820278 RepID=UPI001ADADD1F|nr:hypothetical protein [Aquabacter sp. L1I39]QTL02583.1 hypothetical protein J5J86_17575 [Aquabacter sp. L1I39]
MAAVTAKSEAPKGHDYSAQDFGKLFLKESAKDIVKNSDRRDFFHNLVKSGTAHALRGGLVKVGLQDHLAQGIADHYTIAYELLKKNPSLTGRDLTVFLLKKGIAIARMGNVDDKLTCGISVAVLAVSIVKATGMLLATAPTGGTTTPVLLLQVSEVVMDAYSMNADCKITETIERKVNETAQPVYMWFHNGITEWMGVPRF